MGMIGRWIDTLGERERDAIIQHPDPTYDGIWWWDDVRGCGCLVGCVADALVPESCGWPYRVLAAGVWNEGQHIESGRVGGRFPKLTARFTPERMWRLVKTRAAKPHRVSLEAPAAVVSTEAA